MYTDVYGYLYVRMRPNVRVQWTRRVVSAFHSGAALWQKYPSRVDTSDHYLPIVTPVEILSLQLASDAHPASPLPLNRRVVQDRCQLGGRFYPIEGHRFLFDRQI